MAYSSCSVARNEAWEELFLRHYGYLVGTFRHCCRGGDADDLAQDTLVRACVVAKTYDPGDDLSRMGQRRRARAWLGKIGKNKFIDDLDALEQRLAALASLERQYAQNADGSLSNAADRADGADSGRECSWDPAKLALVLEAIAQLPDKERKVLIVTFEHYEPDKAKERQHLPHEVVSDLAAKLGTSPANIRQLRHKALEHIEKYVGLPRSDWTMNRQKVAHHG